jgi:ketosteroid isomerase-like protein
LGTDNSKAYTTLWHSASRDDEILLAEEELRQAMLHSNLEALESLLDDNLVFTNHVGRIMGKQDDLKAHREGIVVLQSMDIHDMQIRMLPSSDIGIVTVAVHIVGSFAGDSFEETMRFTRVWQPTINGNWRVVAAHSCLSG